MNKTKDENSILSIDDDNFRFDDIQRNAEGALENDDDNYILRSSAAVEEALKVNTYLFVFSIFF